MEALRLMKRSYSVDLLGTPLSVTRTVNQWTPHSCEYGVEPATVITPVWGSISNRGVKLLFVVRKYVTVPAGPSSGSDAWTRATAGPGSARQGTCIIGSVG